MGACCLPCFQWASSSPGPGSAAASGATSAPCNILRARPSPPPLPQVVPLSLGFVGVVLRSQEDIARRRSMADARAAERAFFESHPEYLEVAAQVGVAAFVVRLQSRGGTQLDATQATQCLVVMCVCTLQVGSYPWVIPFLTWTHPSHALQCGVGHLARVLNSLLVEHIRGLLPSLRVKIEEAVGARRKR